ncbi:MAG: outer membrane beta-barrel protein [Bacteroidota bacterium]
MNKNLKFKDFEEGGMDGFLRQTLDGHRIEPRAGLWKTISRKLLWREIRHLNFKNVPARFLVAGTAGLLVISSILYLILPGNTVQIAVTTSNNPATVPVLTVTKSTPSGNITAAVQPDSKISTNPSTIDIPSAGSGKNIISGINLTRTTTPVPASKVNQAPHRGNLLAVVPAGTGKTVSYEAKSTSEFSTPVTTGQSGMVLPVSHFDISRLLPIESSLFWIQPGKDTIISISTPNGILKYRKERQSAVQFYSASLGVDPEVAFNAQPDVNTTFNFWISGRIAYHISRFSVTTGIGLGYVFDEGKYRVDYQSLDSIGYFNNVVSFATGANNEIIYNTETKNVYDSLRHMADDRTRNRYTYLQVPFLLGYRIFESNAVSLTFQAGPAVSFLVSSRMSDPLINYPNARIIKIEDNTPTRVTTNWQLWANLNLEIRLNRKISLYVEPSCKYYLKPIVEQENMSFKAPWSVGLGVGIQFNFGKKQ